MRRVDEVKLSAMQCRANPRKLSVSPVVLRTARCWATHPRSQCRCLNILDHSGSPQWFWDQSSKPLITIALSNLSHGWAQSHSAGFRDVVLQWSFITGSDFEIHLASRHPAGFKFGWSRDKLLSEGCFLVQSGRFDQQWDFEFEYACLTFHRSISSTSWIDPTSPTSMVPIDYGESQWMLVPVLAFMVDWTTVSNLTRRPIDGGHQAAKVEFGWDQVLDQLPVSARWLTVQQRMDEDVDAYIDSVQANVLGQVRSSDQSWSRLSSKLVDTYPHHVRRSLQSSWVLAMLVRKNHTVGNADGRAFR